MATNEQTIAVLEQEARALRARIRDLEDDDFPQGIKTEDGVESDSQRELREAQRKLSQVEAELRSAGRAGGA
jgi:cell division protein FtsB